MPHQLLRIQAPVAASLMTSSSGQRQTTYPNKPTELITGFTLGRMANCAVSVLDSRFGKKINQSIALELLLLEFESKLWGKLSNNINLRTQ